MPVTCGRRAISAGAACLRSANTFNHATNSRLAFWFSRVSLAGEAPTAWRSCALESRTCAVDQALETAGKGHDVQVGPVASDSGVNQDRMMEFFIDALKP